jgi:hypothetical protein
LELVLGFVLELIFSSSFLYFFLYFFVPVSILEFNSNRFWVVLELVWKSGSVSVYFICFKILFAYSLELSAIAAMNFESPKDSLANAALSRERKSRRKLSKLEYAIQWNL